MGSQSQKPSIGVFRHTLLPFSETFIAEQTAHMSNFEVHYFGRESGSSHFNLPNCHLIQDRSESRILERAWYTLTGRSRKLMREMESLAPVLLHAHFGVEGVYALPFAQRLKIPLVTTFHGFDATKSLKELIKNGKIAWFRYVANMNNLKQHGNCFIAVSKFIRDRLIERGFPSNRIIVHYIGIDPERFTPDNKKDDGHTILTVGRLVEKKGTEYLIKSVAEIQREVPDVQLEIVGDGPLRSSLEKLTLELGIAKHVVFRGTLSYDNVADVMKKVSIFCLPSITAKDGDSEGMVLVLLEAAASGKPVVGTFHGGIPEAVCNGENGFLVPERDVDALANRLILLLKNQELRREMAKEGRKLVERDFNISKQSHKLEQLYQHLIEANVGVIRKERIKYQ
jgi:glycosyltransferase involved in cell wall biosynthesis